MIVSQSVTQNQVHDSTITESQGTLVQARRGLMDLRSTILMAALEQPCKLGLVLSDWREAHLRWHARVQHLAPSLAEQTVPLTALHCARCAVMRALRCLFALQRRPHSTKLILQ